MINQKYNELLQYFNVSTNPIDNLLKTKSYVSMDNIHDAILKVGLDFRKPLTYYIIKAKQFAINEHKEINVHYRIIMENVDRIFKNYDMTESCLEEYGFTEKELDLILELLAGVKKYKSEIPRRQYQHLLTRIKEKVSTA